MIHFINALAQIVMFDCKRMPHRGIVYHSHEKLNDRLCIKTVRYSESDEGTVLMDKMRGTGASYDDGYRKYGILELIPREHHIVQTRYTESAFVENDSEFLEPLKDFDEWKVLECKDTVSVRTDRLEVVVSKATCAIRWLKADGELIVEEPEKGGKSLTTIEVLKRSSGSKVQLVEDKSIDGIKKRLVGDEKVFDRNAYSSLFQLNLKEREAIYGLGQHEDGVFNYRYGQQYLYQGNMKVSVPTLISSEGYAFHFDHHSLSTYQTTEEGMSFFSKCVDQLDFFFVYGPEFDDLIRGLRFLTGTLPMLPKWAYGFVQSKERYEDQEELCSVVKRYRDERVPLDCIVLDWESWESDTWGQKSFDATRFPDPGGMMNTLHAMNARLMISIWPIMNGEGSNKLEMLENGFLMANEANYDSGNPDARKMYWKHMNEGLFCHGIDAWWCDCTEPFEADWNGTFARPDWQRLQLCVDEFERYMDPAEINVYSTRHSRGIYEGQRSVTSEKRVVNLTRSATASQQRYGAITWSGDVEASWDRLRKQLADGLNFIVTGNPRWTFDIGAFFVKPGVLWFWNGEYPDGNKDLGYRELYTRWYQVGAFLPMFRSHGTDTAREIWNFGEPGTLFYDIIKSYTELRYRLLPYIYSLAADEVFDGYTMFRSLMFDFREDKECLNISDQFMFGPSIMVCPVLEPMKYAANSIPIQNHPETRKVYLPAGADWYNFWTHQKFSGGQWIEVAAPLETLPLFVRAGSIIPTGPVVQHSGEQSATDVEIWVYPGSDASFTLYEDDGDGYAYEQGAYKRTELIWEDLSESFSIGTIEGEFKGISPEKIRWKNRLEA